MNKLTEMEARELLCYLVVDIDNKTVDKDKTIELLKRNNFIKKTALEEARDYELGIKRSKGVDNSTLLNCRTNELVDLISLLKKAIKEMSVKII